MSVEDKIWVDFESYSEVDITSAGGMAYARSNTTNPICLGWAINDEPVQLWIPMLPTPDSLLTAVAEGSKFYAHGAKFDLRIWNYIMVRDFGWPEVLLDNVVDTMALCATYGLPLGLGPAGEAMGISMPKEKTGKALIKLLCTPKNGGQPQYNDPRYHSKFREMFAYCVRDVEAMRELVSLLPRDTLIPTEHEIWKLTMRMNDIGLPIAYDEAVAIREYLKDYIEEQMKMVPIITNGAIDSITQTVKIKSWCIDQGYNIPDTTAATVELALEDPSCPPKVLEILNLRQELGKSSVAKFVKIIAQAVEDEDGQYWVHDNLVFHGAGPGRWTGRGFQMHNLPRAKVPNPDEMIQKFIDRLPIENPVGVGKALIRPMIKVPKGYKLLVLDYDSIENKMLHWIANDIATLEDFRNNVDQYKTMASARFKVPYDEVTKAQRQLGKVIILGCLAEDTQVITKGGLKFIQHITTEDELWDGDTWVSHEGLLFKGPKQCNCIAGTWMTPDHEVYLLDKEKKQSWHLEDDTQLEIQAICLAIGKLLSSAHVQTLLNEIQVITWCVQSVENEASRFWRALKKVTLLSAALVDGKQDISLILRPIAKFSELVRSMLTDLLIGGTPPKQDVLFSQLLSTLTMADEGYACSEDGSRTLGLLLSMLCQFQDGITQTLNWTEQITKEITNLETSDSSLGQRMCLTHDILNAGKNHRFTIMTPKGPMIVSNCGFGMGKDTFISTAKTQFGMDIDEEEAQQAVWAYRDRYHLVKKLWNDLKTAAVKAVITGKRQTVGMITFGLGKAKGVPWLAMKLPSGKCVYYCMPKVEQRFIPKFEEMGKVPTITHYGRHPQTGRWCRMPLIPGRITENAVQGSAREVMGQGLLNVQNRMPHLKIIGTVHDEGLALCSVKDFTEHTMAEYEFNLCDIPWAKDCPITASGYVSDRYKKD